MNFANSSQYKTSNLFLATSIATIAVSIASGVLLVTGNSTTKNQGSYSSSSNFFPAVTALGDPVGSPAEALGEPYHFDHTVVNKQGLPDEQNASIAIGAYER